MRISPETTIREILRLRPRFVEVLGEKTGSEFWHHLDRSLAEFCDILSQDVTLLSARFTELPLDQSAMDWTALPLHRLLDRLTNDHADFREKDLPEIERLLFTPDPSAFPEDYPVQSMQTEFHTFKIDFTLHMEEEETFLFPLILRTEACVKHPDLTPETFKGSVSVYPGTMLHTPEMMIKKMASDLREKVGRRNTGLKGFPLLEQIARKMQSLEIRLVLHADLETGILLPRTKVLEERLKRRSREAVHPDRDA